VPALAAAQPSDERPPRAVVLDLIRPAPTLIRTGTPSTSTTPLPGPGQRSITRPARPATRSRHKPRRQIGRQHGSASTLTVWAGRPFFITIGVTRVVSPGGESGR
jgi:hypothetical protein